MRKLLVILVLLPAVPAFATFNGTLVWNVTTTGLDVNGGCFDPGVVSPGTDGSLLSPVSYTDLIVGATTTQGTSVAHPFSSTSVGNCINVASGSGCTVQTVEITSVSGVTATFDKTLGTAASTCSGVYGGSRLTLGPISSIVIDGNTVYLQSGTYTLTSTVTWSKVVSLIGYNATHGDLNNVAWSSHISNNPLITTATNSTVLMKTSGSTNQPTLFMNLTMTDTAGTQADVIQSGTGGSFLAVQNSIISGGTRGIDGNSPQYNGIWVFNSEIKSTTQEAIVINGNSVFQPVTVIDSYIHDNSLSSSGTGAILLTAGSLWMERSILVNTTGQTGTNGGGIKVCSGCWLHAHSSIVANNNMDNIIASSSANIYVEDSIIYGSTTGWGIDSGGGFLYYSGINNGFGSNFSGDVRSPLTTGINPITITSGPFTNSGSGDYSLNSTAGGGAALKAAGFPGTFAGGTSASTNLDVGPLQSAGSGGSTSTVQTTVQY